MIDFGIEVTSPQAMSELVLRAGLIPLLRNEIEGFSIYDHRPLWFKEMSDEGPWEWKGPVIQMTGAAYGKVFSGKAGYVTSGWYADLANWRRRGLTMEDAYAAGAISREERDVWRLLDERGQALSRDIRAATGLKRGRFDTILTRLQMRGYAVITDFEYDVDKHGNTYGWGVARLSTPESFLGEEFEMMWDRVSPEESRDMVCERLRTLLPDATDRQILRLVG